MVSESPILTDAAITAAGAQPVAPSELTDQIASATAALGEAFETIERAGRTTYDGVDIATYAGSAVAALGSADAEEPRALGRSLHDAIQKHARALSYLVIYLEEHKLPDAAGFRRTYDAVFAAPDPEAPVED